MTRKNPHPHKSEGGGAATATAAEVAVKYCYRIIVSTLITLVLPICFLVLARQSTARSRLSTGYNHPNPKSITGALFLETGLSLTLNVLVSIVSIAALLHSLGFRRLMVRFPRFDMRVGWFLAITMMILASIGIQGSIDSGISYFFLEETNYSLLLVSRRLIFAVGLHETTLFWWRKVVKPLVDETIFGYDGDEFRGGRLAVRVAIGLNFGGLWWRRLKNETEALVAQHAVDQMVDFAAWGRGLYFLTVMIGVITALNKGFGLTLSMYMWMVTRYDHENGDHSWSNDDDDDDDDEDGEMLLFEV